MRAVVQRVDSAEVEVDGEIVGRIERGLLVYVGVADGDTADTAEKLADKVANLRIFPDDEGKLNLSVRDVDGGVLVVPNFTLQADASKGRRPALTAAASPEIAAPLTETLVDALSRQAPAVAEGAFGEHMIVRSAANGPVNILIEMPGG